MPELKSKSPKNRRSKSREFITTPLERKLLKTLGLQIQNELHKQNKSLEWLAVQIGLSRSALQEIVAGRSNFRFLTLVAIVQGLGYRGLRDFLKDL